MPFMTYRQISDEQKKPLSYKIETAVMAIRSGYEVCRSKAAIAFSGGKDSTVLWHIMRENFPVEMRNTAVIFGNTGVEFPESLKFARDLGKEWGGDNFYESKPGTLERDELKYEAQKQVVECFAETGQLDRILKADGKLKTTHTLYRLCPLDMLERFYAEGLIWKKGTSKNYWWCVDQYGFPILGKNFSKLKARRINIDCFLKYSATSSEKTELQQYYDVLRKSKISQACCDILKKEPSEKIQKELRVDVIFKGLMAAESRTRKTNFATRGYLFKSSRKYLDTPFYHCNPLSLWTDDDVWEYIRRFDVPYSSLYDMEYTDADGKTCKIKRNGCFGCYTDYGRKNSHMYVLRQTHPELWKLVMSRGMAAEIAGLISSGGVSIKAKDYFRLAILQEKNLTDEVVARFICERPCAFD